MNLHYEFINKVKQHHEYDNETISTFSCLKWHHFFGVLYLHYHIEYCVQNRGLTSEEFGRDSGTQLLLFGSADIDRVVFSGDKATEGHLSYLEIVLQAAKIYNSKSMIVIFFINCFINTCK